MARLSTPRYYIINLDDGVLWRTDDDIKAQAYAVAGATSGEYAVIDTEKNIELSVNDEKRSPIFEAPDL